MNKTDSIKYGRVAKAYTCSYPEPLVIKKGEKLEVAGKDTDYPGWIWSINSKGKGGWVPESYLDIEGETSIARRDYSALELTVKEGEVLAIIDEEGGWYLCRKDDNTVGWVPAERIEIS